MRSLKEIKRRMQDQINKPGNEGESSLYPPNEAFLTSVRPSIRGGNNTGENAVQEENLRCRELASFMA